MKIFLIWFLSFSSINTFGQKQFIDKDFCAQSREESLIPIRPGIKGKQPFWNEKAKMFKYAPSFKNENALEIKPVRYRYAAFSFADKQYYSFVDSAGTKSLAPIWDQLPNGNIYLKIEGISEEGYIGLATDRMFYKAATFCPPYPEARHSYKEALLRGLRFLYAQKFIRSWYSSGKPDHKAMPLYCYSAKVVGGVIDGMLMYNHHFPQNDSSLVIAKRAADYLIANAEAEGSPLAFFPQTYEGAHLAAEKFNNEILMTEPAWTGVIFLNLYERTKDRKYLDAAIRIADTYVRNQLPSGTWYIRVDRATGEPTASSHCVPTNMISFLTILVDEYKMLRYQKNVEMAFRWIMNNPVKTFNWTGQFEDVGVADQYQNLTHFEPSLVAMRLFDQVDEDSSNLVLAKELINFCEDQFVVWEKPDIYDDRNSLSDGWSVPAVLEQYRCYLPIDGSTDHMIFTFCKAYERTGDPVYRAKAIALANTVVNCQKGNGMIPTFLYPFLRDNFWPNCMVYSLKMLEKMSAVSSQP